MIERLGATTSPRDVIPGDPAAVDSDRAELESAARRLDEIAESLKGVAAGPWTGDAADNFADYVAAKRRRLFEAADALDAAALALADYASTLRWAQRRAATAIATWAQGEAAARSNPGAGVEYPYQARAREQAQDAIDEVRRVGNDVATTLRNLSIDQPFRPTFWNQAGYYVSELGVGARRSFGNLASLARGVVDPVHRLELQQQTVDGLVEGAKDPIGYRYQLMDADTLMHSPAQWVGGFAPDAAIAAATAGSGVLASRSATVGASVATRSTTSGAAVFATTVEGEQVVSIGRRFFDDAAEGGWRTGETLNDGPTLPPRRAEELGEWRDVNEHMSPRAAAYEVQITGSTGQSFVVQGVKFDGVLDGVLVDAKGPGYAGLTKGGEFIPYLKVNQSLLDQAIRQIDAAQGAPIQWYVAEPDALRAIQALFDANDIDMIQLVHVPPVP